MHLFVKLSVERYTSKSRRAVKRTKTIQYNYKFTNLTTNRISIMQIEEKIIMLLVDMYLAEKLTRKRYSSF